MTTYLESSAGVEAGGKTGLTVVFTSYLKRFVPGDVYIQDAKFYYIHRGGDPGLTARGLVDVKHSTLVPLVVGCPPPLPPSQQQTTPQQAVPGPLRGGCFGAGPFSDRSGGPPFPLSHRPVMPGHSFSWPRG